MSKKFLNGFSPQSPANSLKLVQIKSQTRQAGANPLITLPENLPTRASGARKAGVPTVLSSQASSAPWNSLQTPKSAMRSRPSSPSNRFDGFMSRWIT